MSRTSTHRPLVVGTLVLLASAILIPLVLQGSQVDRAKAWCEELARLMLREREALEDDPGHIANLEARIGWFPTLFQQAHAKSWGFEGDDLAFGFDVPEGSWTYHTRDGQWTSGPPRDVEAAR